MDKFYVQGNAKLSGSVKISRSKNSYLPIMCACLLSDKEIVFYDQPNLRDIRTLNKLLENLGVDVKCVGNSTKMNASSISSQEATYDLVKTMRASILVLGPLLARFKVAKVSLPGGCAIGTRPIDIHLNMLKKMGAEIKIDGGYVEAKTNGLKGAKLVLPFPSVGATENLMMAATLATGETVIENAALEPEIEDLALFLNSMGAKISGIGSSIIKVEGLPDASCFNKTEYRPIADRIEAGTFLIAALATKSELLIEDMNPHHLKSVTEVLKDMGAKFEIGEDFIKTFPSELKSSNIDTAPYPGFPTDLQAQMSALLTQVNGTSIVTEHIFENRFMHVPELNRMGAKIVLKGNSAFINGNRLLKSAPVMCTDLRASAALIISALVSEGKTEILRVYHIDRGYEIIDQKLEKIGVKIERYNDYVE